MDMGNIRRLNGFTQARLNFSQSQKMSLPREEGEGGEFSSLQVGEIIREDLYTNK